MVFACFSCSNDTACSSSSTTKDREPSLKVTIDYSGLHRRRYYKTEGNALSDSPFPSREPAPEAAEALSSTADPPRQQLRSPKDGLIAGEF
jgi:hypothetical protein